MALLRGVINPSYRIRAPIPTSSLGLLSPAGATDQELMLINQPIEAPTTAIQVPYLSIYYSIGIYLADSAVLYSRK